MPTTVPQASVINDAKRLSKKYSKIHYINETKYGWQCSPERTEDSVSFVYPNGHVANL